MEPPAPAYEGDEPYVFVSYSHQDEALINREIRWIQDQGIRIWYDTQIQAGSEWSDALANAIGGCSRFLYFITPNSVASEDCRRELNYGQAEGRSIIAVHLEPTEVPPGLRIRLDNRQAIFKYRLAENDYRSALVDSLTSGESRLSPTATKSKPNRGSWIVFGAVAMLLTMALGWIALREGGISSSKTARTPPSTPTESLTTGEALGTSAPDPATEPGGTSSTQARAHYLVANELWNSVDPERALKELESAVEIDPEYAHAWILMTHTYGAISRDPANAEEALIGMSTAAARAVATAPDYWEAHLALWNYLAARRDWVGSDRAFQKALELAEAAGVVAHPQYTQYLWQNGRHRERQQFIESIRHLDPLFPSAENLYYLGRKEEALAELERMRGVGGAGWSDALDRELAIERGDVEELDELLFAGTDLEGLWGIDAFLDVLRRELASDSEPPRQQFARFAIYAARHGDIDLAVEFLRREYLRDGYGGRFLIWHPGLANVRESEGFKSFLREYGLVAMFQTSGKWNDYCQPVGADDFECR